MVKRVKPGKSFSSNELKYEPFSPATPSLRVSESMLGLNGGVEVEEGLERTWKIQKNTWKVPAKQRHHSFDQNTYQVESGKWKCMGDEGMKKCLKSTLKKRESI